MSEKILFVDDVPAILEGYKRVLYKEFTVDVAVGGEQGLRVIAERGPFAVVISDMRMPAMNGVEFLSAVRTRSPEAVRMMLTGYAEIEAAINAVNEGNIFRFLTKPCVKDVLVKAVNDGLMQHRLIVSERVLLEKTLRGSMQTMAEILSITNPAAFGRSIRLQRYVRFMVNALKITPNWQYDVAALLSQLGCITLHPDTFEALNAGQTLPPEEQERFDKHPAVAFDLLSHIPRMESLAWMIVQQQGRISEEVQAEDESRDLVKTGAALLRTALAYDVLLNKGVGHHDAVARILATAKGLEHSAASALSDYEVDAVATVVRMCDIANLSAGMTLEEDIRTKTGMLVVQKGQEITSLLALRLNTFRHRGVIPGMVRVRMASSDSVGQ